MILTDMFYLEPCDLHNIKESIINQIELKCKDFCSQDIGYITKFIEIKNIKKNIINRCGTKILFEVEYEIENFKPNVGDIYNAEIIHIFEEGIILLYKKMRILIPKQNLNDNNFNYINNSYNDWKLGDIINIEIDKIRYVKCRFDCIANLKL